jgi:hypothetical protein
MYGSLPFGALPYSSADFVVEAAIHQYFDHLHLE